MEHRLPVADWAPIAELARENGGDLPQAALERVVGLYDGEVEHVDRWIGTLRQALEDRGWLDRTIVVFTADHGECFENGVFILSQQLPLRAGREGASPAALSEATPRRREAR